MKQGNLDHKMHALGLTRWIKQAYPPPDQPTDDATLLAGASLFEDRFVRPRRRKWSTLGRIELAAAFLDASTKTPLDPSPYFSSDFYKSVYGDTFDTNIHPFVHYLRKGRQLGYYQNATAAFDDISFIRNHYSLERSHYSDGLLIDQEFSDPFEDYLFRGQYRGHRINPFVNDGFMRRIYGPLYGGIAAPTAFYRRNENWNGIFANENQLGHFADQIRGSAYFDAAFYSEHACLDGADVDPATHYAVIGARERLPCSPQFDTATYLAKYPALATHRRYPLIHYEMNGRDEGRIATLDATLVNIGGTKPLDPGLRTVMIFSHEASRTGAPIVALNVARQMAKTHNVIICLADSGVLVDDFGEVAVQVLQGWAGSTETKAKLQKIIADFDVDFAFVNSVVCHPVLPTLRLLGLPVVSLLHEFASYVYPFGATARMALASDVTVLPADVVQTSLTDELSGMNLGRTPENLCVRPQGYNTGTHNHEDLNADDLYEMIGADPNNPRLRILLGAGYVEHRKGVDLFMQVAQQLADDRDYDWKFVWVGGGFDPNTDMRTSVYLAHQMQAANLTPHMTFIPAQPSLEAFWKISDVFLLSSRLDPFPNVALDALSRAVPVICFDKTTGISGLADTFPFAVHVVEFNDMAGAAQTARQLAANTSAADAGFTPANRKRLKKALSFDTYVADLRVMAEKAKANAADVAAVADRLAGLPASDLRAAVAHIPPQFRLFQTNAIAPDVRTLAEYLVPGRVALPLGLNDSATLAGVSGYATQFGPRRVVKWTAGFGALRGITKEACEAITATLHFEDSDSVDLFAKKMQPLVPFLSAVDLRLTGATADVVIALENTFGDMAPSVIKRVFRGAQSCLEDIEPPSDVIVFANLTADSNCFVGRSVPVSEFQLLLELASGAVSGFLNAHSTCDGVLSAVHAGNRAAHAETGFPKPRGGALPLYGPQFSGVYRATSLIEFIAATRAFRDDLDTAWVESDHASALSLRYAAFVAKQRRPLSMLPFAANT